MHEASDGLFLKQMLLYPGNRSHPFLSRNHKYITLDIVFTAQGHILFTVSLGIVKIYS